MGSAGRSVVGGRRLGGVLAVAGVVGFLAACNRGRPVLEYDETVTTVETAEPVAQRGIDRGAAPPPMVKMPDEEGGTAITPRPPSKMVVADEAPTDAAVAEGGITLPVDDGTATSVVPVPGGSGASRAERSTTRESPSAIVGGAPTTAVLGGGESAPAPADGEPDAAAAGDASVVPAAGAGVQSDAEPDAAARAAGRVELAPTPAQAAAEALPPKAGTAVRTTNPWQKAAPWN